MKLTVLPSVSSIVTKIIQPLALRFPILVGTMSTIVPVTEPKQFLLSGILPLKLKSIALLLTDILMQTICNPLPQYMFSR